MSKIALDSNLFGDYLMLRRKCAPERMSITWQVWFDVKRTPGDVAYGENTGAGRNKYPQLSLMNNP
jgi:hypothetical protein